MEDEELRFLVAFSSPKRSAKVVEVAHARAFGAELVLVRIVPDPSKVGIVAQLISTDKPLETAKKQIDGEVEKLKAAGVNARGEARLGAVAKGIMKAAVELDADLVFVGTTDATSEPFFLMKKDPIVNYLVDNCPVSLFLVRSPFGTDDDEDPSP